VITTSDDGSYAKAVRDAATRFRTALEQGSLRLRSLADFPNGSCGDASELLGQYLSDSGLGTWSYRSGTQSDPFLTHAWVERNGLIVDITADQFPDISEPVLLTTGRTWHDACFPSGPSTKAADLDWFEPNINRADALADYDTLKRRADALRAPLPLIWLRGRSSRAAAREFCGHFVEIGEQSTGKTTHLLGFTHLDVVERIEMAANVSDQP
jgi:hypothetical protein